MTKLADPLHTLALSATIDILRGTLGEAVDYINQNEHFAVVGTLVLLDDQVEDVKAALRLFRRALHADGGQS